MTPRPAPRPAPRPLSGPKRTRWILSRPTRSRSTLSFLSPRRRTQFARVLLLLVALGATSLAFEAYDGTALGVGQTLENGIKLVRAVRVTGWGRDGALEAALLIGRRSDGSHIWHSGVVSRDALPLYRRHHPGRTVPAVLHLSDEAFRHIDVFVKAGMYASAEEAIEATLRSAHA